MRRVGVPSDSAQRQPSYVLRVRNGRFVKLTPSAHFLHSQFEAGETAESIAEMLSQELGRPVTAAEVEAAHMRVRQQVTDIEDVPGRASPLGLWWRVRILPSAAVIWLSRRLAWLFHPAVAVILTVAAVFSIVRNASALAMPASTMADPAFPLLPVLLLLLFSLLAHELGHASSCARFGVPVTEVGFGLYWIYPSFYSDVSAAWALTRRQRIMVDIAGTYLQMLVGAAYLEIYRATGWEAARLAFFAAFSVAILMMLPFFKFDGYWLLSDGLDIANLSKQARRVAGTLWRRLLRRPAAPLPWRPLKTIVVVVYGLLSATFLAFFAVQLSNLVWQLAASYPARVSGLVRDLSLPPHELATGRLHSVIVPTYLLLGAFLAVIQLSRRLGKGLRHATVARRARLSDDADDRMPGTGTGEPGETDEQLSRTPAL